MVRPLMSLISSILSIYMLIIFFRILMTWFRGSHISKPLYYVSRITDPYINWFRRFSFLSTPRIDFSPLAAIMVLVILSNITQSIAVYGRITLGGVLAIIVSAVWSAISFFLMFFVILIVIRLVSMLIGVNSTAPFWMTLDHMLEPFAYRLTYKVSRGKILDYQRGLLITGGILLLIWFLGGFLSQLLITLFRAIPI